MDLDTLVRLSLEEDVGHGDLTTDACVPADLQGSGRIVARQAVVVSGQEAARRVFGALGASYSPTAREGEQVAAGGEVGRITGPVRAILTGERLALNLLMRLSGIATHTRTYVEAADGAFGVVDTRKTTPLHRDLEKAAVRAGGARNHRFALDDGILVKDNHLVAAGGVAQAVRRCRARAHHLVKVEVEADTLEQALEAVRCGADAVLLDNMDDPTLATALAALGGRLLTEASGGMTVERIRRLRDKGIHPDIVSVGGLVHQARWVDLSLELDP